MRNFAWSELYARVAVALRGFYFSIFPLRLLLRKMEKVNHGLNAPTLVFGFCDRPMLRVDRRLPLKGGEDGGDFRLVGSKGEDLLFR